MLGGLDAVAGAWLVTALVAAPGEGLSPRVPLAPPLQYSEPAFGVSWAVDGPFTLGLGLLGGSLWAAHDGLVHARCPCDPREIAGWERGAVNYDLDAGDALSNTSLALLLLSPLYLLSLDATADAYTGDLLLLGEATALAALLTQITKTAVARPYPYLYRDDLAKQRYRDGDNYASMWSGHTAIGMAAGLTFAAVWWRRHPDAWHRYVVAAVAPVLALAAGLFQMSAGNHFPSDVMVGAAMGAASAGVVVGSHVLLEWLPALL